MTELPLLESAIQTTEYCRYCLMCRHICPVGIVTNQERLTPHGWGLTIASINRGLLERNAETIGVLYACADCGMCQSHCVTDQPLPDAITAARAQIFEEHLAPENVLSATETLAQYGNLHGLSLSAREIGTGDTALFVGDDMLDQENVREAVLKLLASIDVHPVTVGNGRSSGQVSASLGDRVQARHLARQTLDEVVASGAQTLLVLTPGDLYTLQQMYPARLGLEMPEGVKVVEVITVLANALDDGRLHLRQREGSSAAAYLDPSHAPRSGRNPAAPRALLAAVLGAPPSELFWSGARAQPSGESQQYAHPEIAEKLARARLEDARSIGANVLITEAPADATFLQRFAAEYGISVMNFYLELAAALA